MALNSSSPRPDEVTSMDPAQFPRQRQAPITVATPSHPNGLNGSLPLTQQSTEGVPNTPSTRMDELTILAVDTLRGIKAQLSLAFFSLKIRYPLGHPALSRLGALQKRYIDEVNVIFSVLQPTDPQNTAPSHLSRSTPASPSHPQSPSPMQQQQQLQNPSNRRHSTSESSVPQLAVRQPTQKLYSNEAQYVKDSIAKNRTTVLTACQGIKKDGDRVERYMAHLSERLQVAEKSYQALGVDIREARMEIVLMKKAAGFYENPKHKEPQPNVDSTPNLNPPILESALLLFDGTKVGAPNITKARYFVPPPNSPPLVPLPSPCSSSQSSSSTTSEPGNPFDLEIFDDVPLIANNEASDDTYDYSTDESPSSSPSQDHIYLIPERDSNVIVHSSYSSLDQALIEYTTSPPPLASHSKSRKRKTMVDSLSSTSFSGTGGIESSVMLKGKEKAREWFTGGSYNTMARGSDERPKKKFKGGP